MKGQAAFMENHQAEPAILEELKRKLLYKRWSGNFRLSAVSELAKYDCQKSRYILTKNLPSNDQFRSKEAGF